MSKHIHTSLILAGIILISVPLACGRTTSTPTPRTESRGPDQSGPAYPTIQIVDCDGSPVEGRPWREAPREDGLYAHLAERIPGFGGLFPEDAWLAVHLMDLDTADRARPTLEWFLRREFPELIDLAHDIHWLQGQYDWRQLAVWRECLGGRMFAAGATGIDIDEGRNRITIGTPDEERDSILERELKKTAVPRSAVIFRRQGLVCPLPLGPSIVAEIRDDFGHPAALGAVVTIRKSGLELSEVGFEDSLLVPMFANNAGGVFEVTIAKPWHHEVVLPRVEVPEGPCGALEPKTVEVVLERLPGAPPVRQVVLEPGWYGFAAHSCGKRNEVAAYLLADPAVPREVRWVSRDPKVVTVSPREILPDGRFIGWFIPLCQESYRATHVVAMAVADSTVRDSIEVSVTGE